VARSEPGLAPSQSAHPSQAAHPGPVDDPYSGRAARALGYVPRPVRNLIMEVGGITALLMTILGSAIRRPTGYWRSVLFESYLALRRASLPATLAIGGFLLFVAVMVITSLRVVGGESMYAPIVTQFAAQTFTIWINAIVVTGVIGAGITADIGARKVREEIDAMEIMGVDPIRELAIPRVLSVALIMTLWSVPSLFVTMVFAQLGGLYVGGISDGYFYYDIFRNFGAIDIFALVVNSFLMGTLIGVVCCYKGLVAEGGSMGLGRAVNQAVVMSFVGVWVMQLAYQSLVLGLFPSIGAFR